jgi:hypothetical protein
MTRHSISSMGLNHKEEVAFGRLLGTSNRRKNLFVILLPQLQRYPAVGCLRFPDARGSLSKFGLNNHHILTEVDAERA